MGNNSIKSVIAWINNHKYFKWSSMCKDVGIDFGNFHRTLKSDSPSIKEEDLTKIIAELKKYGYVDEGEGLPLPADFVDINKTGISILHSEGTKEPLISPISYKKATKKAFDGKKSKKFIADELGTGNHVFTPNKNKDGRKRQSRKRVSVVDLNKQTGKKVITDPPPKTNFTIAMPVKKKGEDALDFAARKNEWKRKQK